MPNLTPYDLTFKGGLHVGTRGINLEEANDHLPSDTLFAAFVEAWRCLGEDAAGFAEPFLGADPDPPFLLTSTLPFAGQVRFYPMPPNLGLLFEPKTIEAYGKAIKRTRFLSQQLFGRALGGEKLDDYLFPKEDDTENKLGLALQGGVLWLAAEEHDALPEGFQRDPDKRHSLPRLKAWQETRVPRVTVTRTDSASTIYHAGRVSFARDCGLWFGIHWRQPGALVPGAQTTYAQAVEQILAYLQDAGLGGERSSGYGAFDLAPGQKAIDLPDPSPDQPAWLLSRYHPRRNELPTTLGHASAAYSLTSVAGWLRTFDAPDQRRKRLYLVQEGSTVFPPDYPAGDVVDVRPDYNGSMAVPHPVYRYGLGLAVGLHQSEEATDA